MTNDAWQQLVELIFNIDDKEKLNEILHVFLTISERETIQDRFALIQSLLTTKQTQREISKNLKISITKVTMGSNALKVIDDDLKALLKKHM